VIVVADAGPLIYLAAIGHFHLLPLLFGRVLVPKAVFEEVAVAGAGLPGSDEVRDASFIDVTTPGRGDLVEALLATGLHRGESEALAIATERHADLVLIDERQGRLTAQGMGLPVVGTVGVLVAAKTQGHVSLLAPLLRRVREEGLWLADDLVRRVLIGAGEPPDP
jgi:predicted nucleic acid-binding protein